MSDPAGSSRENARRIILRYARLDYKGRPACCTPSVAEIFGNARRKENAGTDGKVIYPDRAAAQAAALELTAADGHPLREYPCQRSRKGHFHLTTDRRS